MVVACLFAGVGAWGAEVTVLGPHPYASELFGNDDVSPKYPGGDAPTVQLFIPANTETVDHTGSVEITFRLHGGAVFNANVTALMFDSDGPSKNGPGQSGAAAESVCAPDDSDDLGCAKPVVAPGGVASIVSGGRKTNDWITIKVEATDVDTEDGGATDTTIRDMGRNSTDSTNGRDQTISFAMPRLAGLSGLGGANPKAPTKHVWLSATSRIISGAFTDGELVPEVPGSNPPLRAAPVITAMDSLTLGVTGGSEHDILIDDKGDAKAFTGIKGASQVMVGMVTITTVQTKTPAKGPKGREFVGYLQADGSGSAPVDAANAAALALLQEIYKPAEPSMGAVPLDLYDLNGDKITEGLPGTFSVSAMGTEDFGEKDVLYVDYNNNKMMDSGEDLDWDGMSAEGRALSIDSIANSATYNVYYMPGGVDRIKHGSMLKVTANVDYNSSSSIDEAPMSTSNTFVYDGVGNPVMAYAVPHSTNGQGDKGNVRVRCEASAGCRVFLECWDDMGMRGFGEAPMIAGNNVMVWSGEAIEGVTGMEPTSRHSCLVLSKGKVTVQQLTRDGNSSTLVNNTYVGGGM